MSVLILVTLVLSSCAHYDTLEVTEEVREYRSDAYTPIKTCLLVPTVNDDEVVAWRMYCE